MKLFRCLYSQILEVESKVKAAEGKVDVAEQAAKEAEENPLPEQARIRATYIGIMEKKMETTIVY